MKQEDKDKIREALPITRLLSYYGAKHGSGDAWHCFRHEDKNPSLVANNQRKVATCFSPQCDLKNKRTGKDGLDIFEIIKVVENCNFMQAVERAQEIANIPATTHSEKSHLLSKKEKGVRPEPEITDLLIIPDCTDLQKKHTDFLEQRYGSEWPWLARRHAIRGWHYHIAIPVNSDSTVFIPLDKEKDQIFYRGKQRSVQLFPNRPAEQAQASKIMVVEGEKDVLACELALKKAGKLGEWAVITNTNGAGNVRPDTPLFFNFDREKIEKIVICYDNDQAGERANNAVYENAREYFPYSTQITISRFKNKPAGYDMSDYIREKDSLVR